MPALGSNSRSNIWSSIYQLVVGSQAHGHDRLVNKSQAYRHDSCQIQVVVRCERRVVIVVECRARLSVGC